MKYIKKFISWQLHGHLVVGPEINQRPAALPGAQVALRVAWEDGARNTSEGVFSIPSLAYAF